MNTAAAGAAAASTPGGATTWADEVRAMLKAA